MNGDVNVAARVKRSEIRYRGLREQPLEAAVDASLKELETERDTKKRGN